jgi:hypothetical protein
MPVEYREGERKPPDPRIEKALDWLLLYQDTLRKTFDGLPDDAKTSLTSVPNPHLGTGPMDVVVCANGVIATIQNGFLPPTITAKVLIPEPLNQTMVQYFNTQSERLFTFMDPVSKLTSKGNTAVFSDTYTYDGQVVMVLIADRNDRLWFPPASKLFLMGWQYFDHGDPQAKARDAAKESIAHAYGLVNLRSKAAARSLLDEYRALLANAMSEADLQTFLTAHPEFIYPEHDIACPKPSLGGEREPDFAFSIRSAFGSRWIFVEIERADKRVFTTSDEFQFTREFTQAKGQLLQWDTLITRDLAFFEKRFPGLLKPEFHRVYGRDGELDSKRRDMLIAEFSPTPNRTFSTFDDLANRFEAIVNRIFPETQSVQKQVLE